MTEPTAISSDHLARVTGAARPNSLMYLINGVRKLHLDPGASLAMPFNHDAVPGEKVVAYGTDRGTTVMLRDAAANLVGKLTNLR